MGWVKMKLGDVLKNREGRYKPDDPTIASLKRIDKINFLGQIFLSDKGSNTDMILIKKGDLVISGINVEKGALAVYEGEDDILATIHYSSYIFDTAKIDIDFLKVFLRSPDFIQLLKEQVPGGIKTEIKPKHILPLEVYFPETTSEQKVIAEHFFEKEAKFNQLDMHISYQLTQLENLNQAILQEAVQGKLVKQDPKDEPASELLKRIKAEKAKSGKKEKSLPPIKPEEIPFEIPENWVWCRLGEITDIQRGSSPRPKGDPRYFSKSKTNYNWITISDISNFCEDNVLLQTREFLTEEGSKHSRYVDVNEFIIAVSGSTTGKCCITGVEGFIYDGLAVAKIIENSFDSRYLLNYMMCLYSTINNSKTGASFPNINTDYLNNLIFPLPPIKEQIRINKEIEKQFAKTKQLKEHIIANQQATEQLLKALLHQAFEVREMEEVNS
jgi:type I restriction enzyme S subunit